MKIYFARHGETTFNLHHVLMGQTGNEELDQHGVAQAEALAKQIQDQNIKLDFIFASPLWRARKTALIVGEKLNLPVQINEELAERDYGDLEGKTYETIQKETGYGFPYIEKHLDIDIAKYGGESPSMLKVRLLHFLAEVKDKFKDKKVLAITHKGIIDALYNFFPQKTYEDIENASLHEFEI